MRTIGALTLALLTIHVSPLFATGVPSEVVIKSSLGPGGEYNGNLTYVVQNFAGVARNDLAVQFTPIGSDYRLTTASLALFRQIEDDSIPQLVLAEDFQQTPGTPLASVSLENIPIALQFEYETALYDVDWSSQQIILRENRPYWFVLTQPTASNFSEIRWYVNSLDDRSQWASNLYDMTTGQPNPWVNNDFHQIQIPGFSVLGIPVPEPASWPLIATALMLLSGRRNVGHSCTRSARRPE
jgi:hypothetical protein